MGIIIEIVKELNIEVSSPNLFQAVVAKQYDMNTRFIKATFVDNGDKIYIDPNATVKVVINALRPDGEAKGFDGEVNQDGTVTVPLHSWMLDQVGTVTCDISVIDTETDDNKKLTTTSFTLFVEKAAWDGDGMTNDPQYNLLIELLNSCEVAGEMAEDALKKSTEANSKYDACVEATAAANKVVADNDAIISEMNGRLDEAIAMRSATGATRETLEGSNYAVNLTTNGAIVEVAGSFWGLSIAPGESYDLQLDAKYVPMRSVELKVTDMTNGVSATAELAYPASNARIRISNGNPEKWITEMDLLTVEGTWDLAGLSVDELADLRVGYNGKTYSTAGEAVRQQIAAAMTGVGTGLVRKSITKNRHVRLEKVCPIKHEVKVTATTPWVYDLSVVITGKNLYPVGALEKSYWVSLGNQQAYYPLDDLPPGDYVFSLNCPGDSIPSDVFSLQISSDGGASYTDHWLYGASTYNDYTMYRREVPFTIKEGDKVRLWLYAIADGYDSPEAYNCTECQIEHGSVATAYEEPVLIEGDGNWLLATTDPETRTYTSVGTEMNILTNLWFSGANVNEITYEVEYIASV